LSAHSRFLWKLARRVSSVISSTELADRIANVRETIAMTARRAGRTPADITLVAVTKTMPPHVVVAAARAGLTDFGENRVQEAETKIATVVAALDSGHISTISWHLVGHLQSNKARLALRLFSMVESVDSLSLAGSLNRLARERGTSIDILLEINVGQEESKYGFSADQALRLFGEIRALEQLRVRGLMTVAPFEVEPEATRPVFRRLRALRDQLEAENDGVRLRDLSMGMTGDYPIAIEEGATIVRVGRAIFGDRGPSG
jgi:pyridoxal phosphate enzyme (YggS family)